MKILKNIVLGIGILVALLCAFILMCAANPNITESLSSMLARDGHSREETVQEEEFKEPFRDEYEWDGSEEEVPLASEESDDMPEVLDDTEENEYRVQRQPEDETSPRGSSGARYESSIRGTNGYEPPSESDVKVPEAVSGKSGYQPITEKSEELPDAEGGEYTSDLGYGELGDDLSFDPVFYPYYQMLEPKGQHLYRQIFANASAMNAEFVPIEAVPVSEIKDVVMAVYNDHPELFWLNTVFVCKYDKNRICGELGLEFNMTQEELAEASTDFYNTTNALLTEVEHLGTYEKEKRLHDLLIDRIEYDKGADMNQSAYSALVEGKSVCAGYARAYQYLMQKLGIPCYYCTGYAGTDHAWNIVALDDGYYNVDLTWDDTPGSEYDYFNRTDQEYAATHVRQDLSVNLPQCVGERYRSQ